MAITRTPLIDDDGTQTTGTVFNNAWLQSFYDAIDAALLGTVGTWVPNLVFNGVNAGMSVSSAAGTYTKFGNVVVAEFRIVLTAKGSSTGPSAILGLAFNAAGNPAGMLDCSVGLTGLTGTPFLVMSAGGSTLFPQMTTSTGRAPLTDANFTNTSDIRGSLVYRV
jgi:hypothetical protein